MTEAPSSFFLRARNVVVRPLWLLLVFSTVLFAVVQLGGRIAFGFASYFEDELNTVLRTQNVTVVGLQGGWRGFNPTIAAEEVQFAAGQVLGVAIELDLLRSLWHGTAVLRSGRVEDALVHVEKQPQGWRLRGDTGAQIDIDLEPIWRHSAAVMVQGTVMLHDRSKPGAFATDRLRVHSVLRNAQEQRWWQARVHHAAAADRTLHLQVRDRSILGQRSATAHLSGSVVLPETLLGVAGVELHSGDNHLILHQDYSSGLLDLRLQGLRLGDVDNELELTVRGDFGGAQQRTSGRAAITLTTADGAALTLAPLHLLLDLNGQRDPAAPMVRAWLAALDLDRVSEFVSTQLRGWEPAGRWISEMALQGDLHNVHFFADSTGPGFAASVADLQMQGYKGAPTLTNGQGQVWGHTQGVTMMLNSEASFLQFPDLYHAGWHMQDLQGQVSFWFGAGYLGLRGVAIRGTTEGTQLAGSFSITRPNERHEQRVTLLLAADQTSVQQALGFVPYKIPKPLAEWLASGPRAGQLNELEFAYHGQVHTRPNELGRRTELKGRIVDGVVQYHADWPLLRGLRGFVHAAGPNTHLSIAAAETLGWRLRQGHGSLRDNGAWLDLTFDALSPQVGMLEFVRQTPLRETMSFVDPSWDAQGALVLRGGLTVPINAQRAPPLSADLRLELQGVDLDLPDMRLQFSGLQGRGAFTLPHQLSGEFTGTLFDAAVVARAVPDEDWLRFELDGRATPDHVYRVIDFEGEFPVQGAFGFNSVLHLGMAPELVSFLDVETDLVGLGVALPGHLAKGPAAPVRSEFKIQFLEEYQTVFWRYLDTEGWLRVEDEVKHGAIGLSVRPPVRPADANNIWIGGRIDELQLTDWIADGEGAVSLPLDWHVDGLQVDNLLVEDVAFGPVTLDGKQLGEDARFQFTGAKLKGSVEIPATEAMTIALDYAALPATPELAEGRSAPDPLQVSVGHQLPRADVRVAELVLGDEPFGSWSFRIIPGEDAVVFDNFKADVNGVHIENSEVSWDLLVDRAHFKGEMTLDDLVDTLPLWDYAPSVQTNSASLSMDAGWPGSPLNIEMLGLTGQLHFNAGQGRLLDMEAGSNGGLKILSLINFSKITKRMSFDFSDVVGDGLAFNDIDARVQLQAGQMSFAEPMLVDSASSIFQVGGTVDLHSGMLDNEMIVTLPVSANLPWYGVYLALANPLAGLGVIVGGRMLRKPIEQFSSAKFLVSGTLDQPEVNFVSLFDQSVKSVPQDTGVPVEQSAADGGRE